MAGGHVFISIDAEGLPYASSNLMMMPKDPIWGELRRIMTLFAASAVAGAAAAGHGAVVADSHGSMVNVEPERFYEELERRGVDTARVRLVRGFPRPLSMIAGAEGALVAVFLGYHTSPGLGGVLAHTYSGRIVHRVEVEGCRDADEYLLNTYALGEIGVPVGLVAGDSLLGERVARFTPHAVFVPLKKRVSYYADESGPLRALLAEVEAGVYRAVKAAEEGRLSPVKPGDPSIVVEFNRASFADVAELFPCVERLDGLTVRLTCKSFRENYKLFEGIVLAAYSIAR